MSSEVTDAATRRTELIATTRRLLEESFNDGNLALADEYVAAGMTDHDPAMPAHLAELRGPERLKMIVRMYRGAFPDIRMTVESAYCDGDTVIARWRAVGTHSGELLGFAATGASVDVCGIDIFQWSDGKVVDGFAQWDNLGLARQIGAAPREGSRGDRLGHRLQHITARRMRRHAHA